MSFEKLGASDARKTLSSEEEQAKIHEIRKLIGPVANKFPTLCSDASILKFLRARNWNTKKASKMLKEALKWWLEYKPEKIRWDDIAHEAETGKIYRAKYLDKYGRTVLIMRPGFQNTQAVEGQIKYLVYCMENAISNLNPSQEQMDRYPERLGLAILYNPPKVFESFWLLVKPFLEHKTYKKVKFVYSDQPQSMKIMEALFDMDKLESAFGGKSTENFDYQAYAKRMKEEEKKMSDASDASTSDQMSVVSELQQSESLVSDIGSNASDEGDSSCNDETTSNRDSLDAIEHMQLDCRKENDDKNAAKN
ncbi:Sec14p-like phosphatidylinositol transfer family protein [Forsythia ovata]|uniref:Sec14p-like phosphatidylinositol transfer family protein n=1 Tax=Forsythia ovata TaxID=205694 RepID=A0ABD1SQK9_9LAMI